MSHAANLELSRSGSRRLFGFICGAVLPVNSLVDFAIRRHFLPAVMKLCWRGLLSLTISENLDHHLR